MSAWHLVAWGAGWILLHFTLYAAVLRHLPLFRTESGIFFLHAGSFFLILGLEGIVVINAPISGNFASLCLIASAHGIYSLSFLELWSLSQGGYSLNLLNSAAAGAPPAGDPGQRARELGVEKIRQRIGSLRQLGLLVTNAGADRLSPLGRLLAACFGSVRRLTGGGSFNQ